MTLNDTKKLLMAIEAIYPTFKVDNPQETAAAWHWALEEYPAKAIQAALQIYIRTNKTAFAPSVSQLIDCMYSTEQEQTEGEAWALVKKAIADSNYHAAERYAELPEAARIAIGGPEMLREWAQTDSNTVNTVIMSNFQRSYKAVVARNKYNDRIPPQLTAIINGIEDKSNV
jgi:hypothetical protein